MKVMIQISKRIQKRVIIVPHNRPGSDVAANKVLLMI